MEVVMVVGITVCFAVLRSTVRRAAIRSGGRKRTTKAEEEPPDAADPQNDGRKTYRRKSTDQRDDRPVLPQAA